MSNESYYVRRIGITMNKQQAYEQSIFETVFTSITQQGKLLYVGELLKRAATVYSDRVALIYKDQYVTYRELYQRATEFSRVLKAHGVKPRDRVLMCFENSPEFYISYFAIWQIGAIVAPLNIFLKEMELAHIFKDAQPVLIVTSSDRVPLFKLAHNSLPPILTEKDIARERPLDPALRDKKEEDQLITLEPDEMAVLLYTSGTTGVPKGVMLSSRNILTNIAQGVARFDMYTHERVFGVLPLFHVFSLNACVWATIFMGATVIVVPHIERRHILEGLKHKPTLFLGVPALYGLLCLMKNAPLSTVKYFISGGDALPDKIRAAFSLIYRRKLCNGYGLTETSPLITVDLDDEAGPTNTVGRPCVGLQIAIRNEQGNDLNTEHIGTIWVKGGNIMLGYYQAPEATEAVLKDGWFNTGDLGFIDHRGKLVITGRIKDLIKHKGFNIYPQEIENIILSHPNVLRVGVIGQKDVMVGEYPIAFVQLRSPEPDIEKTLLALCKQHLASYKIPREFICSTKELATTATGKVDKKILRKLLEQK